MARRKQAARVNMKQDLYDQARDIVIAMNTAKDRIREINEALDSNGCISDYTIERCGVEGEVQLAIRQILRSRVNVLEKELRVLATRFEKL